MAKKVLAIKKHAVATPVDPTLPTCIVPTVDGDIRLCLDFGALIDAEEELRSKGHVDVSLVDALDISTAGAIRTFFIIASRRFQPDMTPEHAKSLVTYPNLRIIQRAITELWILSMPKPQKADGDVPDPPQVAE